MCGWCPLVAATSDRAQKKSRPEGRLCCAAGGEDLSRFPHRRNLAKVTKALHVLGPLAWGAVGFVGMLVLLALGLGRSGDGERW